MARLSLKILMIRSEESIYKDMELEVIHLHMIMIVMKLLSETEMDLTIKQFLTAEAI
jgi:hypothetical protein